MSSLQPFSEFVDQAILPRLATEAAYRSVRFTDSGGRFWQGTCPFHEEGHSWPIYVDCRSLRWSCLDGCRRGGQSFLTFLNGGNPPRSGSDDLRHCCQDAAELAGLPPSRVPEITAEDEARFQHDERVASLLETFFLHAYLALRDEAVPPDQHCRELAWAWLEGQGFDLSGRDDLPIGLCAGAEVVREQLLASDFAPEEVDASRLADDPRLAGRLVGPIRDRFGRILSFWALHPEDRSPKFLFKGKWKDEAGLFGLDTALHPHCGAGETRGVQGSGFRVQEGETPAQQPIGEPAPVATLIVVERLLDALLLQSKGLPGAVAIGGSPRELGKRRWRQLSVLGARRVILAFEQADEGLPDTLTTLERAFRVKPDIEVLVLPPECLRGHGRPAELVRAEGIAALVKALETEPVHAFRFKASAILDRHRMGRAGAGRAWTDAGRHAAWKEAVEFYALQGRRAAPTLDRHFVPAIVAGLERTWDTFQPVGESLAESAGGTRNLPVPATGTGETPVAPCEPTEPRPSGRKRLSGTCPIHGCDVTSCFCFD